MQIANSFMLPGSSALDLDLIYNVTKSTRRRFSSADHVKILSLD